MASYNLIIHGANCRKQLCDGAALLLTMCVNLYRVVIIGTGRDCDAQKRRAAPKALRYEDVRGSGCTDPRIFNLCTTLGRVVSRSYV
jgi:hypothetical protein